MCNRIGEEGADLTLCLKDRGSSVYRYHRESGCDKNFRESCIECLIRALRTERRVYLDRISTGTGFEIKVMG